MGPTIASQNTGAGGERPPFRHFSRTVLLEGDDLISSPQSLVLKKFRNPQRLHAKHVIFRHPETLPFGKGEGSRLYHDDIVHALWRHRENTAIDKYWKYGRYPSIPRRKRCRLAIGSIDPAGGEANA